MHAYVREQKEKINRYSSTPNWLILKNAQGMNLKNALSSTSLGLFKLSTT